MTTKRRSSRVTLSQVAQAAGVSTTTVSVILSGRQESLSQFNPDTIERVRQSAVKLGYHANLFASGLNAESSPFFALVTEDIVEDEMSAWQTWGFEGEMITGVLQAATGAGYYPIVATVPREGCDESLSTVQRVIAGGVFGTICKAPCAKLEEHLRFRMEQGHRVVILFPREEGTMTTNSIDLDNHMVGTTAATLFEREAVPGPWAIVNYDKPTPHRANREKAFLKHAEQLGIEVEQIVVPHGHDEVETGKILAPMIRESKAKAIFAADSVTSVATLLAAVEVGKQPGQDIMLVGCDAWMWQSTRFPRITSVDVSWRNAGLIAMDKLTRMLTNRETTFENVLLEPRIVVADTCPVPDDMPNISKRPH